MNAHTLQLAVRIADDAARGLLLTEMVPSAEGEGWMDLSHASPDAEPYLSEALEYLAQRGLLLRAERNAYLVHFTNAGRLN